MECSSCGGLVIWTGWNKAVGNFTHTECQRCGAINNQVVYYEEEEDEAEEQDE